MNLSKRLLCSYDIYDVVFKIILRADRFLYFMYIVEN